MIKKCLSEKLFVRVFIISVIECSNNAYLSGCLYIALFLQKTLINSLIYECIIYSLQLQYTLFVCACMFVLCSLCVCERIHTHFFLTFSLYFSWASCPQSHRLHQFVRKHGIHYTTGIQNAPDLFIYFNSLHYSLLQFPLYMTVPKHFPLLTQQDKTIQP